VCETVATPLNSQQNPGLFLFYFIKKAFKKTHLPWLHPQLSINPGLVTVQGLGVTVYGLGCVQDFSLNPKP
jgi:hypothetical protein